MTESLFVESAKIVFLTTGSRRALGRSQNHVRGSFPSVKWTVHEAHPGLVTIKNT
jgi:hypothetical protein